MKFYKDKETVKKNYEVVSQLPYDMIVCYKEVEDGKSENINLDKIGKAINLLPNLVDGEFYIAQARCGAYIGVSSSVNDGAVFNQIKDAIESALYSAVFAKVGLDINFSVDIEVLDELTDVKSEYTATPIVITVSISYKEKDDDAEIPKFVCMDLVDAIRIAISMIQFTIDDHKEYLGVGLDMSLIEWMRQAKEVDPLYNYDDTITYVSFSNNYEIGGEKDESMGEFITRCLKKFEEM